MADLSSPDVAVIAVPCLNCAYDLRGYLDERRCPECGTAIFDELVRVRNNAARDIGLLHLSAKWGIAGLGLVVPGTLLVILFGGIALCVLVFALFTYAIGIILFLVAMSVIIVGGFQENRREQLLAFRIDEWIIVNVLIGLPLLLLMLTKGC